MADIELALVVAAIGAQYRFERRSGERLYHAAKSILTERLKASGIDDISPSAASLAIASIKTDGCILDRWNVLRVLILLIGFAAWDENSGLLKDAYELQSILSSLLRRQDVSEDPHVEINATDWLAWVEQESRRRTLLVGFAYLGIQNLAYDLTPSVCFSNINVKLPCSALQWAATSAEEWTEINMQETYLPSKSLGFQHAMEYLLSDVPIDKENTPDVSTLGNFVLLQALLQRIEFAQHMQLPRRQGIREADLRSLGSALDRWKSLWRRDRGSSLDPNNPDGPLPFTSVAFLALGYVRLHLNMGPHRNLLSRDPEIIAAALGKVGTVERGSAVTTAISHSVHALSLPIRMGIEYVSRSQMFFWSCQHSLCGLECAVFTWKWLETIHVSCDLQRLSEDEACMVDWIRSLVCEATQSVGTQVIPSAEQNVANLSFAELGVSVLRLWSRVFIGNTMWPVICQIGKSLEMLASTVEKTWVL
ncbi:amidase signature enzyme [Hortaea werneckii]|nr:amidase signature enzyme [Hortaea werneckii]